MAGKALTAGASILGGLAGISGQNDVVNNAIGKSGFNPFNFNLPGGSGAVWDTATGTLDINQSPYFSLVQDQLLPQLDFSTSGIGTDFLRDFGLTQQFNVPGLYGAAQTASGNLPAFSVAPGLLSTGTKTGMFTNQLFPGAAQAALQNPAFSGALGAFGLGQLGEGPTYDDLLTGYEDRLGTLRANAQTGNERLVNKTFNNLFGTGKLGTTGGAGIAEGLQNSLDQQDLGFQTQAFGDSLAAQGQLFGQGLAQNAQGINALNSAISGNNAGLANLLNFGTNAQNLESNLFNRGFTLNNLAENRADTRLRRAMDMFGFGTGLEDRGIDQSTGFLNTLFGLDQQNINLLQAAIGLSGANQPNTLQQGQLAMNKTNPKQFFGDFLTSFGINALGSFF